MSTERTVAVWDPLVRVFHWSLVLFFSISYITSENEDSLVHPWSGYAIVALLLVRLIWGFVGSKHARFSDFVYGPAEIMSYAKGLMSGTPKRYLGHNPLGGVMVVALLLSLAMTTITGMLHYGIDDGKGPLGSMKAEQSSAEHHSSIQLPQLISSAHADDDGHDGTGKKKKDEPLKEVHEFFGNFTLFLVLLHIGGVVVSSKVHKESLVKAMVNGRKPAEP